jgi:hypothetical protein
MPDQIWFKTSGTRLVSEGSIAERNVDIVIAVNKLDTEGDERNESFCEMMAEKYLKSAVRDFKLPLNKPFKLDKIENPDPEELREVKRVPFHLAVKIYELKD